MTTSAFERLVPIALWSASLLLAILTGFVLGILGTRQLQPAAAADRPAAVRDAAAQTTPTVEPTATPPPTVTPLPLPTVALPSLSTQLNEITGAQLYRSEFGPYEAWEDYFRTSYGANGLDRGVYAFELIRAETLYDLHPHYSAREFLISADIRLAGGRGRQGFLLNYVGDPLAYSAASFTRLTIDSNGFPLIEEVSPAGVRNIPFETAPGAALIPLTNGSIVRLSAAVSTEGMLLFVNGGYIGRAAISPPQSGFFGMIAISELDGGFYRVEFDNLTLQELRRTRFDS